MNKFIKFSVIFFAFINLVTLIGCAASGPIFSEEQLSIPSEKGKIIFYNLQQQFPYILISNNEIGLLRPKSFFTYSTNPGTYTIEPHLNSAVSLAIEIKIITNSIIYLRLNPQIKTTEYIAVCSENETTVSVCKITRPNAIFEVVPKEIAQLELSTLKQSQQGLW